MKGSDIRYTPAMYVRHACCLGAAYAWKVLPIGANAGVQGTAAFLDSVVAEVRRELKAAFRRVWPDGEGVTDAQINLQLESLLAMDPPRPTFVALPDHVAANKAVADAILSAFPRLKLLLMTTSPQRAAAIAHAVPLVPLPEVAVETGELQRYNNILAMLPP